MTSRPSHDAVARLHRIAYCSRSRIEDREAADELHAILEVSRRKNPRLGVTGALLYSGGSFAQVLEGPLDAIERIFESIQCDGRHSDVMLIESGPIDARLFPTWAMAFAGDPALAEIPDAKAAFDNAFAGASQGARTLLRLLQDLVVEDGEWAGAGVR
ncbi:MAG: BLUF domain-containing protein [Vicinamibacterales bacterium]